MQKKLLRGGKSREGLKITTTQNHSWGAMFLFSGTAVVSYEFHRVCRYSFSTLSPMKYLLMY